MIFIGVALLLVWLLIQAFTVILTHALLAVAVVFIILGLVIDRPWTKLP